MTGNAEFVWTLRKMAEKVLKFADFLMMILAILDTNTSPLTNFGTFPTKLQPASPNMLIFPKM